MLSSSPNPVESQEPATSSPPLTRDEIEPIAKAMVEKVIADVVCAMTAEQKAPALSLDEEIAKHRLQIAHDIVVETVLKRIKKRKLPEIDQELLEVQHGIAAIEHAYSKLKQHYKEDLDEALETWSESSELSTKNLVMLKDRILLAKEKELEEVKKLEVTEIKLLSEHNLLHDRAVQLALSLCRTAAVRTQLEYALDKKIRDKASEVTQLKKQRANTLHMFGGTRLSKAQQRATEDFFNAIQFNSLEVAKKHYSPQVLIQHVDATTHLNALQMAVKNVNPDAVDYVLTIGGNPNVVTDRVLKNGHRNMAKGSTCLHLLIASSDATDDAKDVAKFLHAHNCDFSKPDQYGNTPLHLAAKRDDADWVSFLIQTFEMKVSAENNTGKTPLMLAQARECQSTVEVLEKAAAQQAGPSIRRRGCAIQ